MLKKVIAIAVGLVLAASLGLILANASFDTVCKTDFERQYSEFMARRSVNYVMSPAVNAMNTFTYEMHKNIDFAERKVEEFKKHFRVEYKSDGTVDLIYSVWTLSDMREAA